MSTEAYRPRPKKPEYTIEDINKKDDYSKGRREVIENAAKERKEKSQLAKADTSPVFEGKTGFFMDFGKNGPSIPYKIAVMKIEKIAKEHGFYPGKPESEDMFYKCKDGKFHINAKELHRVLTKMAQNYDKYSESQPEKKHTIKQINQQLIKLEKEFGFLSAWGYPIYEKSMKKYIVPEKRKFDMNEEKRTFGWYKRHARLNKFKNDTEDANHNEGILHMRRNCLSEARKKYPNLRIEGAKIFTPINRVYYNAHIRDFYRNNQNGPIYLIRARHAKRGTQVAKKYAIKLTRATSGPNKGEFVNKNGYRSRFFRNDVLAKNIG